MSFSSGFSSRQFESESSARRIDPIDFFLCFLSDRICTIFAWRRSTNVPFVLRFQFDSKWKPLDIAVWTGKHENLVFIRCEDRMWTWSLKNLVSFEVDSIDDRHSTLVVGGSEEGIKVKCASSRRADLLSRPSSSCRRSSRFSSIRIEEILFILDSKQFIGLIKALRKSSFPNCPFRLDDVRFFFFFFGYMELSIYFRRSRSRDEQIVQPTISIRWENAWRVFVGSIGWNWDRQRWSRNSLSCDRSMTVKAPRKANHHESF